MLNKLEKIIYSVLDLKEFPLISWAKELSSLIINNIYVYFHETWIVYLSFLCFALFYIIIMKVLDSRLSETARKNKKEMELSYFFQWDQPLSKTLTQVYDNFWPLIGFIGLVISMIMNPAYCAGEMEEFTQAQLDFKKSLDVYDSHAFENSQMKSEKDEIFMEGMLALREQGITTIKHPYYETKGCSPLNKTKLMELYASTTDQEIKEQVFEGWKELERKSVDDYQIFSDAENKWIIHLWNQERPYLQYQTDEAYFRQLRQIREKLVESASLETQIDKSEYIKAIYYSFIDDKQVMLAQLDEDQFRGIVQMEYYDELIAHLLARLDRLNTTDSSIELEFTQDPNIVEDPKKTWGTDYKMKGGPGVKVCLTGVSPAIETYLPPLVTRPVPIVDLVVSNEGQPITSSTPVLTRRSDIVTPQALSNSTNLLPQRSDMLKFFGLDLDPIELDLEENNAVLWYDILFDKVMRDRTPMDNPHDKTTSTLDPKFLDFFLRLTHDSPVHPASVIDPDSVMDPASVLHPPSTVVPASVVEGASVVDPASVHHSAAYTNDHIQNLIDILTVRTSSSDTSRDFEESLLSFAMRESLTLQDPASSGPRIQPASSGPRIEPGSSSPRIEPRS